MKSSLKPHPKPLFIINFKTYEQTTGKNALRLAKAIEKASPMHVDVILSVQPFDLREIASSVKIPVYSQHLDPVDPGSHTGWILPLAVKRSGGKGTLLNHSEHMIDFKTLEKSLRFAKSLGLTVVACADTPTSAGRIAKLRPDFLAIEPPELIGGNISVSEAKPDIITKTIKKAGNIPVLVGAGIKTKEDVRKGMELGARGILVASGVVKASRPGKAVKDMLQGFY